MNYKKESKEFLQKYMDKFHVVFKDQKEAEQLAEFIFMEGYSKGLDYCLTQKPIK